MFGGRRAFLAAFLVELVVSVAYAPVMMIQQTLAVGRYFIGIKDKWVPQRRGVSQYSWSTLIKFHCAETVLGGLLVLGMSVGLVSLWLLPIALSLVCAVPLSAFSAYDLTARARGGMRMDSPHTLREPKIVSRAKNHRAKMRSLLKGWQMPAE
jgi:membrane glycosyltransferase